MKIIIAPDSFKGSNSSISVASLIEKGIKKVFPKAEIVKIPIADGGEGTVEAVVLGAGGELHEVVVTGPLGDPVKAKYGILGKGRAVIEMAAASGLTLIPEGRRDPLLTTTYGTGQLIRTVIDKGCREILIGIGGSATNDAGIGMAQALGYSFSDSNGKELGHGGGELAKLARIDGRGADERLKECRITVACDVTNPLYGKEGAAYIYGPQKGADQRAVELLDKNLRHFANIVRQQLGQDISRIPGAGAAGGLGAGLILFCQAELKSGIEALLDLVHFQECLAGVDLVVTGEGRIDGQSSFGKVPVGVAAPAQALDIPVLVIAGEIGDGTGKLYAHGIDGIMSTVDRAMSLEDAIASSSACLEDASERAMRIMRIGMRLTE